MGFAGAGGEEWVSGTEGIVLPTSARWFQLCASLCTWPTRARLPALEDLGSGKGPPTPSLARVDSRHRIPLECNVWLSSGKCQRGQVQSPRLAPQLQGPWELDVWGEGDTQGKKKDGGVENGGESWGELVREQGERRGERKAGILDWRRQCCGQRWRIEMNLGPVFIQDPQGSESAQGPPRRFSFWASGDPFTPAEAWRVRAPRVTAPWGWPGRAQAWELGWMTWRAAFPLFHFPKFPQCWQSCFRKGLPSTLLSLSPPHTRGCALAVPGWTRVAPGRGLLSGTVHRPVPRDPREGSLPLLSSEHLPKEIKVLVPLPLAPGVKRKWGAESHEDTR